jgi:hypothetical protein
VKISSLFAGAAERTHTLREQIASAESRYYWWFDHPPDWERPRRTLYITGWCVSREGRKIRAVRARIGRQEFAGNYGIERKDVGAAVQRIGLAIALPLPAGKSQVCIEVQEADRVWRAIAIRDAFGASDGESAAPIDPKYFIPNPGANPRIEFWIDEPVVWPKKIRYLKVAGWCIAFSGDEVTEVRARVGNNIFPARFGKLRPDIGLRYDNRPGALRSGFSLNATIPPGRSQLIMEARSGEGPWERFFPVSVAWSYFPRAIGWGVGNRQRLCALDTMLRSAPTRGRTTHSGANRKV